MIKLEALELLLIGEFAFMFCCRTGKYLISLTQRKRALTTTSICNITCCCITSIPLINTCKRRLQGKLLKIANDFCTLPGKLIKTCSKIAIVHTFASNPIFVICCVKTLSEDFVIATKRRKQLRLVSVLVLVWFEGPRFGLGLGITCVVLSLPLFPTQGSRFGFFLACSVLNVGHIL